jgi:pseudouridine-5'-phosphate glycosidase
MSRQDLQGLAVRARKKLRNAELDKARMGQRAAAVAIGAGAAGLMGYVMGGLRKDNPEKLGTDEDPTKIAGVDLDLAVGLAATVAGVVMSGKTSTRRAGEFVEAAGTGILAFYAGTWGHSLGMEEETEEAA